MRSIRKSIVPVCLVLLLAGAAGCGGDDDAADVKDTVGPTSTTTVEESTTENPSTTTTSTTSTTGPAGSSTTTSSDAEVDETATEVDWSLNAVAYRGRDGLRVAFDCPAEPGAQGSVWGTDTYTDDSSVCTAAAHSGLITDEEGGRVVIEIAPGEESYTGSTANGIESLDYGSWDGSYTFVTD